MKKESQQVVNALCDVAYKTLNDYLCRSNHNIVSKHRLNSCQAEIVEYEDYICLYSYNTLVAFIDRKLDTCYDVLRLVYGYTATSAQHITKFYNKFSKSLDVQPSLLRYYPV